MSIEDKPIGPFEAEMPYLLGSNPIGKRTALDAMHHYPLLHYDFETSPVTEVRPPSVGCFFSARSIRIAIGKLRGITG